MSPLAKFNALARYAVTSNVEGKPLVIRDLGPWDQHMTVTNDVERVVEDLFERGLLTPGRQLLYFDSDNQLDEIVWGTNKAGRGVFLRFLPGGTVTA